MARDRRRVAEATAVAALLSGAPSTLHAFLTSGSLRATGRYICETTRAAGTLVPPGRPGMARGTIIHVSISTVVGEAFGRVLPTRRSALWGAAAGLAVGVFNMGLIGRLFPAIRALPLIPQLADHIAFGTVFALVADRGRLLRSRPDLPHPV